MTTPSHTPMTERNAEQIVGAIGSLAEERRSEDEARKRLRDALESRGVPAKVLDKVCAPRGATVTPQEVATKLRVPLADVRRVAEEFAAAGRFGYANNAITVPGHARLSYTLLADFAERVVSELSVDWQPAATDVIAGFRRQAQEQGESASGEE